jgi:hypothetical protein
MTLLEISVNATEDYVELESVILTVIDRDPDSLLEFIRGVVYDLSERLCGHGVSFRKALRGKSPAR